MTTRAPRSHEEIVRRTVPNPDSSWRPSPELEKKAVKGAADPEEQALCEDVHDALIEAGIDATQFECCIDRDRVGMRGTVRDRGMGDHVIDVVERVPGVKTVVNQLRTER